MTEEHKNKIREAQKRKWQSIEYKNSRLLDLEKARKIYSKLKKIELAK